MRARSCLTWLALAVALGGDCLAEVAMPRAEPAVFAPVASDPTVSRLIDALAASENKPLRAIGAARAAESRQRVWRLADQEAPDAGGTMTVDLDGVLVIAHSDKEDAAPTWEGGSSSTTDRAAPVNRSRPCSGRATQARTRPPTTSPPNWPEPSCRNTTGEDGGCPTRSA
uniref:Transposase n=1 Tax=Streptomyces sp. NBC_01401 TaxID=2903854 RepID=A0AAU3H609_9ACTN